MDISAVGPAAISAWGAGQGAAPATERSSNGFGSVLDAAAGASVARLDAAEQLVGTRISAPPGGCGCDSLVAAASPARSGAPTPSLRPQGSQRLEPAPGDLLVLAPADGSGGRPHLAIARSVTEMIAASATGLVEIMPIPWERLLRTDSGEE